MIATFYLQYDDMLIVADTDLEEGWLVYHTENIKEKDGTKAPDKKRLPESTDLAQL